MGINERIKEFLLWSVAVAFTLAAVCTAMAWIAGIALLIVRWLNG